ncbi:MAG: FAD-binding protein [Planctomycetota bacterium]|jgi:succinate dehydrogenase/fumarate reductase flavoprotein subunit/2-keto-3-deoxy-6-phosphogluconate aldolase
MGKTDIEKTIGTLLRDGFILVFNQDKLDIVRTAQALMSAGVNNMEVTCRIKKPLDKLARLRKELPDFVAGAASLIDFPEMLDGYNKAHPDDPLPTLGETVDAGAGYLVSAANFSDEGYRKFGGKVAMIPGCGSVTEIVSQFEIFPARQLGGPAYVRAIDPAIHKTISLVPTGGTNAENIDQYIDAGVLVLGGSFSMINEAAMKKIIGEQDYELLAEELTGIKRLMLRNGRIWISLRLRLSRQVGRPAETSILGIPSGTVTARRAVQTRRIGSQTIRCHSYNTVIVGAGAAGMNCAAHLYEFMRQKGLEDAQKRIVVVTGGLSLGASRMSGSDKQTYYKMGTSCDVPDSASDFAESLTAAGCCHGDLAMVEAIGSLREFYHLVQAGVPFPHDSVGGYIGYKTDHDPYERATSAGPKTSKFMSERLERQVRGYGIQIHDHQEVAELLTTGRGESKRIIGVVTVDKMKVTEKDFAVNVYYCENLVLAAGGPGELYETSVYPKGQVGIHGLAFKAGLAAENLTESQFGLASTGFRWNVSGSYCQAVPRIFSADARGNNEREFLADYFPTTGTMATNIFLKGYQWPFDPQRIENLQSSLVDVVVFNEMQKGRRVFMDFMHNPVGGGSMKEFNINDLEPEAYEYLKKAGALQSSPIERLFAMNPPAIEVYKENGIDLYSEPLEIAVCAQHNNGGFAVDKWWQSNIGQTFVIGEMAGTHGVKRPGGSALNAGQVGGLRAAEYIVNVHDLNAPGYSDVGPEVDGRLSAFIARLERFRGSCGLGAEEVIGRVKRRMSRSAAHIRRLSDVRQALGEAVEDYVQIRDKGFKSEAARGIIVAIQAEHMALASVAYLKAIAELLGQASGSRGSHLVLAEDGMEIHPDIVDRATGRPIRFRPENLELRNVILRVRYDPRATDLFVCEDVPVRQAPVDKKAFEPAWRDYREGNIYLD